MIRFPLYVVYFLVTQVTLEAAPTIYSLDVEYEHCRS